MTLASDGPGAVDQTPRVLPAPASPVEIDREAPGCPVARGTFSFGGTRGPLDSFAVYDEINTLGSPVYVDEGVGFYVVTDRDDVAEIAANPAVFSSDYNPNLRVGGIGSPYPMKPLQTDPPEHLEWRRLLAPAFAPKAIRRWETKVRQRAVDMIDGFVDLGRCDLIDDFAKAFPTTIFLDFMGLPISELPQFLEWETAILHPGPDGTHAGMTREDAQAAVQDYFAAMIAERRRSTDPAVPDLLTDAMTWGVSDADLLSFALLMFAAGLDTVTAELGYGMLHLATHPADRAELVAHPELVPDAVEELMRVYSIAAPMRVVLSDAEIGGCPVKRGDNIILGLPGTGRHEGGHEDATRVDFRRPRKPNSTFGFGAHKCVGAHLARLELKVAYEEWHRRIPEYRVAADAVITEEATMTLGLNTLPLEWDPVRG